MSNQQNEGLIIPEYILATHIENCLEYIKDDYNKQTNKKKTFLYKNVGGVTFKKHDYFAIAVELFTAAKNKKQALEVTVGYNFERASMPTIHIIVPDEDNGPTDGIGFGETTDVAIVPEDYSEKTFMRSFAANYNLLITSVNQEQTVLIYHLLRALLIGTFFTLDTQGLQNPKLRGQDITLQQDLMSPNIFHRILSISFFYEQEIINLEHHLKPRSISFVGKVKN